MMPAYEAYFWRTVGSTLAAVADPNFARVLGGKYGTSNDAAEDKAERERVRQLLALSKANAYGNFYVYWAMLTVAMRAHHKLAAHVARFQAEHPDIAHCLPGVLPIVTEMIGLFNSADYEAMPTFRQRVQEAYERACNRVQGAAAAGYDDSDTLRKAELAAQLLLSGGGKRVGADMLDALTRALAAHKEEARAWQQVERRFAELQLGEAAINLTEPTWTDMTAAIEAYFQTHPVHFFTQNYAYCDGLDKLPALPIAFAAEDGCGGGNNTNNTTLAQCVQVDAAALSERVLHHVPWEVAFVPHDRPFQGLWSEIKINLGVLNAYTKFTQLQLVEEKSECIPNHVSIGLHVYGRYLLEDLVHAHDERLGPHFYVQNTRYLEWVLTAMAETKIIHWDPKEADT